MVVTKYIQSKVQHHVYDIYNIYTSYIEGAIYL